MTDRNVSLLVAGYGDDTSAAEDFKAIKDLETPYVVAAVVTRAGRGRQGRRSTSTAAVWSPPAPRSARSAGSWSGCSPRRCCWPTAVGAGIGAGVGALAKRHEEKAIGVDAEEWLPPGSSAIVAVVDDLYLDRVDKAVGKASQEGHQGHRQG